MTRLVTNAREGSPSSISSRYKPLWVWLTSSLVRDGVCNQTVWLGLVWRRTSLLGCSGGFWRLVYKRVHSRAKSKSPYISRVKSGFFIKETTFVDRKFFLFRKDVSPTG